VHTSPWPTPLISLYIEIFTDLHRHKTHSFLPLCYNSVILVRSWGEAGRGEGALSCNVQGVAVLCAPARWVQIRPGPCMTVWMRQTTLDATNYTQLRPQICSAHVNQSVLHKASTKANWAQQRRQCDRRRQIWPQSLAGVPSPWSRFHRGCHVPTRPLFGFYGEHKSKIRKGSCRDVTWRGLVVTWRLIRDWSYLLTFRPPPPCATATPPPQTRRPWLCSPLTRITLQFFLKKKTRRYRDNGTCTTDVRFA